MSAACKSCGRPLLRPDSGDRHFEPIVAAGRLSPGPVQESAVLPKREASTGLDRLPARAALCALANERDRCPRSGDPWSSRSRLCGGQDARGSLATTTRFSPACLAPYSALSAASSSSSSVMSWRHRLTPQLTVIVRSPAAVGMGWSATDARLYLSMRRVGCSIRSCEDRHWSWEPFEFCKHQMDPGFRNSWPPDRGVDFGARRARGKRVVGGDPGVGFDRARPSTPSGSPASPPRRGRP